jgi:hypothetical protein
MNDTTRRLAPPQEHDHRRWHWIETEHGPMAASWFPSANDVGGYWDISGHVKRDDDPKVLREWEYLGPAIPPERNTDA